MNTYVLELDQGVVGIRWRHEFDMASDAMAREWAAQAIKADKASRSAHGAILFRIAPEEACIAHWEFTQPDLVLRMRTR